MNNEKETIIEKLKEARSKNLLSANQIKGFKKIANGESKSLTVDEMRATFNSMEKELRRIKESDLTDNEKRSAVEKEINSRYGAGEITRKEHLARLNIRHGYNKGSFPSKQERRLDDVLRTQASAVASINRSFEILQNKNNLKNEESLNNKVGNVIEEANLSKQEATIINEFSEGKISKEEAKEGLKDYGKRVSESIAKNFGDEEAKSKITKGEEEKPTPKPPSVSSGKSPSQSM
jgi:hypothetical protein